MSLMPAIVYRNGERIDCRNGLGSNASIAAFASAELLLGGWLILAIIRRMIPGSLHQAVTEEEIGREIIRLVPQWYEAACGPEEHSIPVGKSSASFFHHSPLTPNLAALLDKICPRTRELQLERFKDYPGIIDILVESFAVEWLRMHPGRDRLGPPHQLS